MRTRLITTILAVLCLLSILLITDNPVSDYAQRTWNSMSIDNQWWMTVLLLNSLLFPITWKWYGWLRRKIHEKEKERWEKE